MALTLQPNPLHRRLVVKQQICPICRSRGVEPPGPTCGPCGSGYRSSQVCEMTGCTYRQLDYWRTTGLVTPSAHNPKGSGNVRLYSETDLHEIAVILDLLERGMSLQAIRDYTPEQRTRLLDALEAVA